MFFHHFYKSLLQNKKYFKNYTSVFIKINNEDFQHWSQICGIGVDSTSRDLPSTVALDCRRPSVSPDPVFEIRELYEIQWNPYNCNTVESRLSKQLGPDQGRINDNPDNGYSNKSSFDIMHLEKI